MIPRQYSICVCVTDLVNTLCLEDQEFIFLGEIPNLKDHCIVVGLQTEKTYIGFHVDNFEEAVYNHETDEWEAIDRDIPV